MNIKYRQAEEKDVEDLTDLRIKLIHYECKNGKIEDEEQLRNNIIKVISEELNKTMYFFIALDEEKIIATSAVIIQSVLPFTTIPDGKFAFITNVFTDEQYRRKGIQKKLIKMSLDYAKEYGCKRIELNANDPNAIKLYKSFGFKKMDTKFRLESK